VRREQGTDNGRHPGGAPGGQSGGLIQGGQSRALLTAADGLSNPTAVEVQDQTVYVCDGAVAGGTDPNLLTARIDE
jgi:hypothetical protein